MMCKFNTRLFSVFVSLIATFNVSLTLPASRSSNTRKNFFLDDYDYDQNFDLHYDERQNGTENYRINLNGFLIAPSSQVVSQNSDILSDFGISENDFLSFIDKNKNERGNNLSTAYNNGLSTSRSEDLSKPSELYHSSDSSGKSINRDSVDHLEKPDQYLKLKLPFVSFLRYLRRNTN